MEKGTANIRRRKSVKSQISEHKQMPGRGTQWGNFKAREFVNRFTPIPSPLLAFHTFTSSSFWLVTGLSSRLWDPGGQAGMILTEEQINNQSKERHYSLYRVIIETAGRGDPGGIATQSSFFPET